ncbi:potassium channel family protein [Stackebrandtia albiflava]|uniref:potassium channel family protein n=1 Tax=Stackebrandtia albiflava TaxID=406432 RepID=UPI001B87C876|nr:potassium channel family protein [Stackebrandtia albiflava]
MRTLARPVAGAVAVTAGYFLIPLDTGRDAAVWWWPVTLAAVTAVTVWQLRAISRDPRPRLRAVGAFGFSVLLFLLAFATGYRLSGDGAFSEPLDRVDALYFTVTVFATVGFGDITPRTGAARLLVTIQMLSGLVILGAAVRLFLAAVRTGLRRRTGRA